MRHTADVCVRSNEPRNSDLVRNHQHNKWLGMSFSYTNGNIKNYIFLRFLKVSYEMSLITHSTRSWACYVWTRSATFLHNTKIHSQIRMGCVCTCPISIKWYFFLFCCLFLRTVTDSCELLLRTPYLRIAKICLAHLRSTRQKVAIPIQLT